MSISRIQKGDKVKIISGKYRNTEGVVTSIKGDRASVSGVEKINKYQRANRQYNLPGSMTQVDRLIHVSNLALIDDKGTISKVKIDTKDGHKFRVYKSTGKAVKKEQLEKSLDQQEKDTNK